MAPPTVVTSIPPTIKRVAADGIDIGPTYLRRCIASWISAGYRVISVNGAAEAASLANSFPDVEFRRAQRTSASRDGRELVYLGDLLSQCDPKSDGLFGIVNADIWLRDPHSLAAFLDHHDPQALSFGQRFEIGDADRPNDGQRYIWGYDYFFFRSGMLPGLIDANFVFGESWWDYWLPIALAKIGYRLRPARILPAAHLSHGDEESISSAHRGMHFSARDKYTRWLSANMPLPGEGPWATQATQVWRRFEQRRARDPKFPRTIAGDNFLCLLTVLYLNQDPQLAQSFDATMDAAAQLNTASSLTEIAARHLSILNNASAAGADPDALHLQAYLDFEVGDFDRAESCLQEALLHRPNDAGYTFDLGLALWAKNDASGAAQAFARTADLDPSHDEAARNAAALDAWRRIDAVGLPPSPGTSWVSRAKTAMNAALGRTRPNIRSRTGWRIAARDFPEVREALGLAFVKRGNFENAAKEYRKAIALQPTSIRHARLSFALRMAGQIKAAEQELEKALALDPRDDIAERELASLLQHDRRYTEALRHYRAIVTRDPNHAAIHCRLLELESSAGEFDAAESTYKAWLTALYSLHKRTVSIIDLSAIAYRSIMWPIPLPLHQQLTQRLSFQLDEEVERPGGHRPPAVTESRKNGRLRIGYLSSGFADNPIGHVTSAFFGAHNRSRYEVHVFQFSASAKDPYTEKIAAGCENFYYLQGKMSEAAATIAAANLDILIYLDGYMSAALLQILTRRLAQVQVYWLGHAGGCDIASIDYLIADAVVFPRAEEKTLRAKVVRLPHTYHCASPHEIAERPTRHVAGLPDDGFVFCAFNNAEKITRQIFDAWMRILKAVQNSVLWLSDMPGQPFAKNLKAEAELLGVAGSRIIVAERLPDKAAHLARQQLCGLFLDTLSLNASTTALDALWAGVPLITVKGPTYGSRIASSLLGAIGLDDMICNSLADYERRAIFLAQNHDALSEIRARLERNRDTHPLFQTEPFCRDFEHAIESIWADHSPRRLTASMTER